MVVRRRMILQLTSLVDLLFIIMFLQYMELRDTSTRQVRAEAARRHVAEMARSDANRLKESALANTAGMTQRIQELEVENRTLQDQIKEANKKIAVAAVEQQAEEQRAANDVRAIANVVKDMLGIAPDAIVSVIGPAPDAEKARLRERFEQLKNQPPARLVQHLRETAELKKYCEIWEVHIYSDNSIGLDVAGSHNPDRFFVRNSDEFANRLVAAAREHGEPKSLVIICLTWANADLFTREQVIGGMKAAVIALKGEWGGNKRIEFAKLGYSEVP